MTFSDATRRPYPAPDELTAPFWAAAANRRLVVQRCVRCDRFHHPPVPRCPDCGGEDLAWRQVSGRGTVFSTCRVWVPAVPGFSIPYVVLTVQLEEQPDVLMTSNWAHETAPDIGAPVEVTFEQRGEVTIPQFVAPGQR